MGTTFTLKIAAATAAIVTAAGLAAAAPAAAETQTHRDARGDVEATPGLRAAPRPDIDIVRGENTYRGNQLTMSLSFADLQRRGFAVQWSIQAPTGNYILVFDTTDGRPQVTFFSTDDTGRAQLHRGLPPSSCASAAVQRRGDVLTGIVPRGCIEGADLVRVAAASFEPQEGLSQRIDDARRRGLPETGTLKYGPILERN